jgi:hypothetical protein
MSSWLSLGLGTVGPALTCIGVAIQFFELQKYNEATEKITSISTYISRLEGSIAELAKEDQTPGTRVTKEGHDIGEAYYVLQKGVEEANKRSRKYLSGLTDELIDSAKRRKRSAWISFSLVAIGTVLWGASSFA